MTRKRKSLSFTAKCEQFFLEKKDDSINIQTTNKYNGENNREEEKEENINQEQHQLKSRANKIFLETKQKIIIKDKILYVQMVGFFQKSATFFKEKISMEQITNKKKQSCCHFECKIMLVFLSGTSIATMFVSSAKFFELQSEVSEVQRLCGFGPIFYHGHIFQLYFSSRNQLIMLIMVVHHRRSGMLSIIWLKS